jgi:hypothetical protein
MTHMMGEYTRGYTMIDCVTGNVGVKLTYEAYAERVTKGITPLPDFTHSNPAAMTTVAHVGVAHIDAERNLAGKTARTKIKRLSNSPCRTSPPSWSERDMPLGSRLLMR